MAVATDRSETADRAVRWAAAMAERYDARLLLIQVLVPANPGSTEAGAAEATRAHGEAEQLAAFANELAGERGSARVIFDTDPARAIVQAAEEGDADVLVVGNAGMSGRREFLLGNVPNRISHSARCTVIIVNSTLDGDGGAPRAAAALRDTRPQTSVEPRLIGRAAEIGAVMARHGLRELFARAEPDDESNRRRQARGLRSALEELGPTFAKLGQVLSTRPDLLPPVFIEELATLQDNVPPLTEDQVVRVMEEELGVPWEDVFEGIDASPMAAGTIAQVHRATLTDGERVVIKVQRPTAREEIMQDLALLELFAEKTSSRPAFRQVVDMQAVFEHLSASLQRELDFRQEAANVERMRRVLEPYDRLDVPRVHEDVSSSRLLVLQEIEGGPIRDAPEGPERSEAAHQLLESYYRQILTDGFFHADPHPGNLMWWQDKIYFLDFGMVGELGPEMREQLMLLLLAFWQEDVSFLTDVTLSLAGGAERADLDVAKFRAEIGELMAKYRNVSLQDIQLGPILQEMSEIAIRHDVPLPASLTLTGKALAQMQLATAELDPTLDPFEVAGRFLMRSLVDRVRAKADPKKVFYEAQKLKVRLEGLAEAFERIAGARPGPKPQISFRAENLERTVHRAGRHLALGLTSGAAVLGAAFTAASSEVAGWVPATLGALGGGLTLGLIVDILRSRR